MFETNRGLINPTSGLMMSEINVDGPQLKENKNQYQYIKLIAKTYGTLPSWHLGFPHDGKSWLFADEISIN